MENMPDLTNLDPNSAVSLFVADMEGRDDALSDKALRYGLEALLAVKGKDET